MAEVVIALEGSLVPMQCFTEPGTSRVLCNHEIDGYDNCATKLLWTRVQGGVDRALEQTTLAELVSSPSTAERRKRPNRSPPGTARRAQPRPHDV